MIKIGLAMPSRGRPDRAKFALESAFSSAANPENVVAVCALDDDDTTHGEYVKALGEAKAHGGIITGKFGCSVKAWNEAVRVLSEEAKCDVIHMAADDLEYFQDWDKHVVALAETMGDYWVASYTDDYRNESRVCNPFVSAKYIADFGFLPEAVQHFHSDEWLELMARFSGCHVHCPAIHIRHNHPKEGRASWDQTYLNPRTPNRRAKDSEAWESLQEKLKHESARLRRLVQPEMRLVHSCDTLQPPSSSSSLPAEPTPPSPKSPSPSAA